MTTFGATFKIVGFFCSFKSTFEKLSSKRNVVWNCVNRHLEKSLCCITLYSRQRKQHLCNFPEILVGTKCLFFFFKTFHFIQKLKTSRTEINNILELLCPYSWCCNYVSPFVEICENSPSYPYYNAQRNPAWILGEILSSQSGMPTA